MQLFFAERFNLKMAQRIEIVSKEEDMRAEVLRRKIRAMGFHVGDVKLVDAYTFEKNLNRRDRRKVADMLMNPVSQAELSRITGFDYAVQIGFLPGVTDNVGNTAREIAEDGLKGKIEGQGVSSSQILFLSGDISREDAIQIGESLANPLIQSVSVKKREEYFAEGGMSVVFPKVRLPERREPDIVEIINATDEELAIIGKQGIANPDGTRRGPLSMTKGKDISYMKVVQDYFRKLGRNPRDAELEMISQGWSEHCKHTIFADPIDDIKDGLFKHFIKSATEEVRRKKGKKDFCVSVFTDNAGGIVFDDEYLICDKAETHNSPSALDPFGGSITGIVGVNRDPMGFGIGAKPIINGYGFCFGNPEDDSPLYKDKNRKQKMLSPKRILEGVVDGVKVGGNCSGIPTPQGFMVFDETYKGKPLVFVRTIGLIPRKVNGRKMHEKQAKPGDYIVMVGGRVGKDGIHGATFSSEAIDSGSPATAVQIGDPITQKKMSDALIKEARDLGLYNSITDNGAGGLSCSVSEMAKESGGFRVELEKVPVKYPGIADWETWVSESQERMTLAVPKNKWRRFSDLMRRRGVEATLIGEFTDSGKCHVTYEGKDVINLDMDFVHEGLPPRPMTTNYPKERHEEPPVLHLDDLTNSLHSMLKRKNIASNEFISQQYDHEVQGGSVIKPLQGKGRVNGDATVVRPRLNSKKALVLSQGINPSYSQIDTYHMAACAIDTAVRNSVAAGADLEHLALLDNFCWCSSDEPERLGQLKAACKACYDYSVEYGTPFISGKDSMFNDFKGFDKDGNPVKISVLPTLLISSLGVIKDARKAVSIDAKLPGDLIYVLGADEGEMGGSEYFAMRGEKEIGKPWIGNSVPKVSAETNLAMYRKLSGAIQKELVASAVSVHRGGLAVALARSAMAGMRGMDIDLAKVPTRAVRADESLYSESQGRIVVSVNPANQERFEKEMQGVFYSRIGQVREEQLFRISGAENERQKYYVATTVGKMLESYKSTFRGF